MEERGAPNAKGVVAEIWGGREDLFDDGFFVMPSRFLRGYSSAKQPISNVEFMYLLQVLSHKWTHERPYPSYRRLAQLLGITERMARRHADSLERKGYLYRSKRPDKKIEYDLEPLFKSIPAFPMTRSEQGSRAKEGSKNGVNLQ
jgi:DNA-binding transcriptional regulator YhcF (GntR family)